MVRDRLIDAAIRMRVDEPLRRARARVSAHSAEIAEEERELSRLLAGTLTPASNCIDIGGYRGRVLEEMLRLAPGGRHIAYEPNPYLHERLAKRFPSVDVRCAAVSNQRGSATFTVVRDAPALSGLRDRWDGAEHRTESVPVRLETLDGDLPDGYVPDFIKIDVEGAERLVFEGAIRTIAEHKPTILFEHGKGAAEHYATGPGDIHRLLVGEAKVRIFAVGGDRPLSLGELEEAFERNDQWNFVARA